MNDAIGRVVMCFCIVWGICAVVRPRVIGRIMRFVRSDDDRIRIHFLRFWGGAFAYMCFRVLQGINEHYCK